MIPRPEYPRPQFCRERWINLNGVWSFAFDHENIGIEENWQWISAGQLRSGAHPFTQRITVPFCYQAPLSGISDPTPHDVVWYGLLLDPPSIHGNERWLLHFGAVDYRATVWLNGVQVAQHEGGHTPFSADVTHVLRTSDNVLIVRVQDPSTDPSIPRGKQAWTDQPSHIFYTRTTGIWQTVWLEPVNQHRIEALRVTPDVEAGCVDVEVTIQGFVPGMIVRIAVTYDGQCIVQEEGLPKSACEYWRLFLRGSALPGDGVALWSPEHPNLYHLRLELLDAAQNPLDVVTSYFGMRSIEVRDGTVCLNGQPFFQRLVLDQGYFPAGILTAPSDGDLRRDIELAKSMGFNGARKHQKVEDPRWLYWADHLGFLVWGEMANAYEYSLDYVQRITTEWQAVVRRDYNHPCIVTWLPINESSGGRRLMSDPLQVEHILMMYHLTRSLDATRLVVSNDGWEIVTGDLCTIHDYSSPAVLTQRFSTVESSLLSDPPARSVHYPGYEYRGEPILVTEFGGIILRSDQSDGWGYTEVADADEFARCYSDMIKALTASGVVQGFCYTQLTDVEHEVTGLLRYDRQPKVDLARIRDITTQAMGKLRLMGQ